MERRFEVQTGNAEGQEAKITQCSLTNGSTLRHTPRISLVEGKRLTFGICKLCVSNSTGPSSHGRASWSRKGGLLQTKGSGAVSARLDAVNGLIYTGFGCSYGLVRRDLERDKTKHY